MKNFWGALLVVGCLACFSGCRTSEQGYVAKGNKAYDDGKYADAAINYSKALQKDQNYGEAYYRLGLAEIKEQNARQAYDALYRAVELVPNNIDAKEQLGSLTLELYMVDPHRPQAYYNLVKRTSDALLQRNPNSFEGLREKGYLAITDGKRDDAIAIFRKALLVKPSDPNVTAALVQNLLVTGHVPEAEKMGLDLIARHKSYGAIYDVLYEHYVKDNRPAEAENIIKAKADNNPKESSYQLELAAHYDRVHKPAEMQATLQRLLDNPKDFPQARLQIGDLYFKLRNYPEAVRYFEQGARMSKDADKVLYQKEATNALLAEGKNAQASSTVDQILGETPKDLQTRLVQANILLRSRDPKSLQAAQSEFQELLKQKPNDANILLKLGQAEELQGNMNAARARYQEALSHNSKYLQARYALAEMGLAQQRPEETLQQAAEILKVRPDDPAARLLHAQALARTGNVATARVELTRIKDFQHNSQAQMELGLLALSEKKYPEAQQIFGKLRGTGNPEATVGLARTYALQKQFDKAQEVLTEGLKKSSDAPLLLGPLANVQAMAGKYDAAIATFQKLILLQPKSPRVRLQLGEVFAIKGDDKNAVEAYGEAVNWRRKTWVLAWNSRRG